MPEIWDAFIQDYTDEILGWPLRKTLKLFWYYCQDGCRAVNKCQQEEMQKALKEG